MTANKDKIQTGGGIITGLLALSSPVSPLEGPLPELYTYKRFCRLTSETTGLTTVTAVEMQRID